MAHPGDIYQYVANIDFDFKNLQCKAGQPLPDKWQHRELIKRLQQNHGENCVTQRVVNFRSGRPSLPPEEIPPVAAEIEEPSEDVSEPERPVRRKFKGRRGR